MKLTQVTHNDLDGYGASAVVSNIVAVERVEHVVRYSDVVPVLEAEFRRLAASEEGQAMLVTDIAVEGGFACLAAGFAGANALRRHPHRLLIIDHHASSIPNLEQAGFMREDGTDFWHAGWGGSRVTAIVDVTRCATRLCAEHDYLLRRHFDRQPDPTMPPHAVVALVEAVDAVDLWKRERPAFDAGEALNELFWEIVQTYVPPGHEAHDRFVSDVLGSAAILVAVGGTADEIEAAAPALRKRSVERMLAEAELDETPQQRAMTSRMRVSRLLARSDRLFAEPFEGLRIKVTHGMDPGIMQRTSDFMLDEGVADVVVNVMRGGAMSFRSRGGEALALAERFGGGGHASAAGARLPTPAVFSLDEAIRLMREVLEAPAHQPR